MRQKREKTWIYAVCIFVVLLIPLVILLQTPKGNGGMYAKIESKLSDAIVKYNQREYLELRVSTAGEGEDLVHARIWISGENWLREAMVITENGQKTVITLQYDGIRYHSEDGIVTCTEETIERSDLLADWQRIGFSAWERQWNGAFTASGEGDAPVEAQVNGITRQRMEYDVNWRENLRQVKTIWMTENRSNKRICVLDILGWNKKLCKDQIEAAYTQMQAALNETK